MNLFINLFSNSFPHPMIISDQEFNMKSGRIFYMIFQFLLWNLKMKSPCSIDQLGQFYHDFSLVRAYFNLEE